MSLDPERAKHFKRNAMTELARHPFRPAWWLRNAHAQSCWSPLFRRPPQVAPKSERWDTPDGDFIGIHTIEGRTDAPQVLLLHGLEGSIRSNYMIGMMRAFSELGWSVTAMEHRSCSGELNRTRRMYHSGETTDLDFVARRLIERRPDSRLYVAGVSLGANQIGKWLGELGDLAPDQLAAAAIISPPFDLTISAPHTDRSLGGFYTRRFLRTLIPKAVEKDKQFPGVLNIEAIRRATTFEEFDTHATAPLHGFVDAWDYWKRVSCGQFLSNVRRPLLLIAAEDDPFNPGATHPIETASTSPWLVPQFTTHGGHVGFVAGVNPRATRHWAEEQIVRFFLACEKAVP